MQAMSENKLYPPLASLRAFEAVGRLGGIRKAARELTIDHAVVSRHIRSLEIWIGRPLLERDGNERRLTDDGLKFHQEIAQALVGIASATGKLIGQEVAVRLNLWCIPGFATLWLADRLNGYLKTNSQMEVNFRPSDQMPNFLHKDVDCDIRYLHDWEEGSIAKGVRRFDFARPHVFPVASPEYLAKSPQINDAADLLQCRLLHEDTDAEWSHWFAAQGMVFDERLTGPRFWHAHLTLGAAKQGEGITLANHLLLCDDIEAGRLVRINHKDGAFSKVEFGAYVLLARDDRWNEPAIREFRKWLQKTVNDEGHMHS
jgi:DNA-binding transcriptional LysR family regulator